MKSPRYWILQILTVLLAYFGAREIANSARTSKELLELKDQKIELLVSNGFEQVEIDRIDGRIERLETNDLYQGSVYLGLGLIVGSIVIANLNSKLGKTKKENKSVVTTPEAARPTS